MLLKILSTLLLGIFLYPVELEKKNLFDNKLEILVPKGWKPMKEELLKIKYPGPKPPTLVYSDVSGGTSLAFNHTDSRATPDMLEKYKEVLKSAMMGAYPEAEWKEEGIKEINGKKTGFYKVITDTNSGKIFNQLFFIDMDGRLLICSFNCVKDRMTTWEKTADEIMNSLTIK